MLKKNRRAVETHRQKYSKSFFDNRKGFYLLELREVKSMIRNDNICAGAFHGG